jgi:pimeloyl-ACP methyl ester carboxylesterase
MTVDRRYIEVAGRQIAYRLREGALPTIVFLSGYASDMEGTKALALDGFAKQRGFSMLRFDYSGTGSSAGRFADGTLERWLEESLAAIDQLAQGPIILVGSSMGGWIGLHIARLRKERVRAIVGVAAAPDFTDWGFSAEERTRLQPHRRGIEPDPGGSDSTEVNFEFWQSAQQLLLLDKPIDVGCPVRLIHGEQDEEVPVEIAFRAMRAVCSGNVQLTIIKGGRHRLSQPLEITTLLRIVADLLEPVP